MPTLVPNSGYLSKYRRCWVGKSCFKSSSWCFKLAVLLAVDKWCLCFSWVSEWVNEWMNDEGIKQLWDDFHDTCFNKEPAICKQCELRGSRLHNTTPSTTSSLHFHPQVTEWSKHSRHEEYASRVGHTTSSGWGGTLVIAIYTTQQAQEKEGHNEGQQEAGNQATQPPGEKVQCYVRLLVVSLAFRHYLSNRQWLFWLSLAKAGVALFI